MATIRICDITEERVNEKDPKKIVVGYHVENDNVPDKCYEVSDEIYELFKWVWDSSDNVKALFTSIKKRKMMLERKGGSK